MKKIIIVTLGILVFVAATGFVGLEFAFRSESARTYTVKEFSIHEEVAVADIKLGQRMYAVRNGCIDCHGPDLAGAVIMENGAMGSIRGPNLTPAMLKDWTDEEIARAIRYGVGKNGRTLRFMPSFDFKGLSKGDIAALIAYLRSVPPVEAAGAENRFGPVAKGLSLAGKMPIMFPAKYLDLNEGFAGKPAEAATVEFGRYLAQSCTGCHGQEFRGGPIEGGDPSWPEAPGIRFGASANWNEAVFKESIRTGVSPGTKKEMRAPMPVKLLQQWDDTELTALWSYLKTLN
ncbi:MAG: c-type cytochrome [Bdellovibrionales bacterium]|nr:c-type cytochrome [Bdellovibrionales bacterium]